MAVTAVTLRRCALEFDQEVSAHRPNRRQSGKQLEPPARPLGLGPGGRVRRVGLELSFSSSCPGYLVLCIRDVGGIVAVFAPCLWTVPTREENIVPPRP